RCGPGSGAGPVSAAAADAEHLIGDDVAVGQRHIHAVAGLFADQRRAHRALVADAVGVHVGLGGAGDVVLLGFVLVVALGQNAHMHANGDGVVGQGAVVNDAGHLQGSFQVGDAGLDHRLLFLGGVVLGILGQVAVAAGDLDF